MTSVGSIVVAVPSIPAVTSPVVAPARPVVPVTSAVAAAVTSTPAGLESSTGDDCSSSSLESTQKRVSIVGIVLVIAKGS